MFIMLVEITHQLFYQQDSRFTKLKSVAGSPLLRQSLPSSGEMGNCSNISTASRFLPVLLKCLGIKAL